MSETDTPPPYVPRPTLFSFIRKNEQQTIDLSHIRDIVSDSNLTPASIAKVANDFAANLRPAQFAKLLQKPNIEGHTALYWSIVNHGREAFFALATFVPQFTPACSSDLRQACSATSDQELFAQLNLGRVINSKDESLRRFLGCPPDEAQVSSLARNTLTEHHFSACFCIRMFQKRLRANPTQALGMEFILGGRIWLLKFSMIKGKWCMRFSLSDDGAPVSVLYSVLVIQAPSGKIPLEDMRIPHAGFVLTSDCHGWFQWHLDWLMNDKTMLDYDGTLHAKLEITLTY